MYLIVNLYDFILLFNAHFKDNTNTNTDIIDTKQNPNRETF